MHEANLYWSHDLTATPHVWLTGKRRAQNFWSLNAASRNVTKSWRPIREPFLFSGAAALCAVTHSMRIFITESFVAISSNLMLNIGVAFFLHMLSKSLSLRELFSISYFQNFHASMLNFCTQYGLKLKYFYYSILTTTDVIFDAQRGLTRF